MKSLEPMKTMRNRWWPLGRRALLAVWLLGAVLLSACASEKPVAQLYKAEKSEWQQANGTLTPGETAEAEAANGWRLPAQWDNRLIGRTASIKNQGDLGTCWAFAALGALETLWLPGRLGSFSVDHLTMNHGHEVAVEEGGNFNMALSYLAGWKGPVWAADDPYADGKTNAEAPVQAHLQEAQLLQNDRYAIKEAVLRNGSVQSSLYADDAILYLGQNTQYYRADTCAYYYDGAVQYNHDVLIVGWDDSYSRDNFTSPPPGDGAYICQNSWGEHFGDQGFFYVSYYDSTIGQNTITYSRLDEPGVYDAVYQHDQLGWTGQMGYEAESAWGANLFTATSDEKLAAAGFYTTAALTSYEVYVDLQPEVDEKNSDFSSRQLVAQGSWKNAGYYTVEWEQPLLLKNGQRFAVIVRMTTPGAQMPLAAEYQDPNNSGTPVQVNAGESFISSDGLLWQDSGKELGCNVCIKAFTKRS